MHPAWRCTGSSNLRVSVEGTKFPSNASVDLSNKFAVVRVTPNMFVSLNVWGAYVFWALICGIGIVVLGLWAPETKGVPMERMGELFSGHWWMGWRAKLGDAHYFAEDERVTGEEKVVEARVENA